VLFDVFNKILKF